MAPRLRLEVFDTTTPGDSAASGPVAAEAVEDVRLAAYDKGYAAGWEDATASQADSQARLRDDLASNLRNLSFTYWEARSHLLQGLEPLLRAMVDRVLPEVARDTLGAAVVSELRAEAEGLASAPAVIEIAPGDRALVEAALGADPGLPVTLRDDPALGSGQVHFRFGAEERALDLGALLAAISTLVDDFLNTTRPTDERQINHG